MISSQLFLLCIHFIFLLQNITSDTLYHALDYNSINFLTKWIWAILTMTSTASSGVAEREPGENKIYFFICFYSYFPPCSGEKTCQKQILKSHQHSICAIITISSELDTDLDKKYTKKNNFHNKDANINEDYYLHLKLTAILKIHKEFSVWRRRRFWCHWLSVKQKFPSRF